MYGAERDVRLLAVATSATHLRQRLLLPVRVMLRRASGRQLQVVAQFGPWRIRAQ
jgi:hypothetical protein